MTPPANLLYIQDEGQLLKLRDSTRERRSDWLVRCIPNLFPALSQSGGRSLSRGLQGRFPHSKRAAKGAHEIIIESPVHDDHPHRANQEQIALWLQAAIDRVNVLGRTKNIVAVSVFRNHGREAGASIAHAHSQIIATPLVPPRVEEEQRALNSFHEETGRCALCYVRAAESNSERKILNTRYFSVFTPWASVFPFEFWIVPKRHSATIVDLSKEEIADLAKTIGSSFRALARLLSDPPYNLIFHLRPSTRREKTYHWHIEVYPKLSIHAGFELGTGMYINTLKPEAAAKALISRVECESKVD